MKRVVLYNHTGSLNHGCEAIVRGTAKILKSHPSITLTSLKPEEDDGVGLNSVVDVVRHSYDEPLSGLKSLFAKIAKKVSGTDDLYFQLRHAALKCLTSSDDVALSVGGDNYCYGDCGWLYAANRVIRGNGTKAVFWGCSVDPENIDDDMLADLNKYAHIVARESISFQGMLEKGVFAPISLFPDPAFVMDKIELPLPDGFLDGNTVGINLSPLILEYEKAAGNVMRNVVELVHHILNTTDSNIMLIPHVTIPGGDDRTVLADVHNAVGDSSRVFAVGDHNAMELKGYISKCRMFIGARTHATIAAYSSCVPTITLGYSVKSLGIARDIFGSEEGLVFPVQQMASVGSLVHGFDVFRERESDLRACLDSVMPAYIARAYEAGSIVARL